MSDWVYHLDSCAAAGILDYDAAADILDMPARYVGNPRYEDIAHFKNPSLLPEGTKMKDELQEDEFNNSNLVNNPGWKKKLFAGVTVLTIGGIILRILSKKGKIPSLSGACDYVKDKFSKVGEFFKTKFGKGASGDESGFSIKEKAAKVWEFVKKPFVKK